MSMMVGKEKLVLDTTALSDSDNVGAYLRDSNGALLTSTLISGKQALDVNIVAGPDDPVYDEDSAATNGEKLMAVAAVRQDALASSVDTDGDHAWLKLNARGALWSVPVGTVADDAVDNENPIKVGSRALAGPLAAVASGDRADAISDLYRRIYVNNGSNIAVKTTAVDVTDTAASLVTALGGRRQFMIQNLSNKEIYIGPATVATTDGWRIAAGAAFGIELGENVSLFAVAATAGPFAVRVLEVA